MNPEETDKPESEAGGTPLGHGADAGPTNGGQPEELSGLEPSRGRSIVIALAVGLLVVLAIFGITAALSSSFDSFAKKAASSIVPDEVGEPEAPVERPPVKARIRGPEPETPPSEPPAPTAPGL